jgi:hypothetical protein
MLRECEKTWENRCEFFREFLCEWLHAFIFECVDGFPKKRRFVIASRSYETIEGCKSSFAQELTMQTHGKEAHRCAFLIRDPRSFRAPEGMAWEEQVEEEIQHKSNQYISFR